MSPTARESLFARLFVTVLLALAVTMACDKREEKKEDKSPTGYRVGLKVGGVPAETNDVVVVQFTADGISPIDLTLDSGDNDTYVWSTNVVPANTTVGATITTTPPGSLCLLGDLEDPAGTFELTVVSADAYTELLCRPAGPDSR